jgi:hypothetical protein
MDFKDHLLIDEEKNVYQQHSIDTNDIGYRNFVSPITDLILKDFTKSDTGLDFGSGRSNIISSVLKDFKYDIVNYDPIYNDNKSLLKSKYDYISSCEVIEHFFHPYKEFKLLKSMMKKGAKLYLMSEIYTDDIEFSKWYYKNDPTHVFFYHKKAFQWIKEEFGFSSVSVSKRLVVFEN